VGTLSKEALQKDDERVVVYLSDLLSECRLDQFTVAFSEGALADCGLLDRSFLDLGRWARFLERHESSCPPGARARLSVASVCAHVDRS